MNNIPIKEAIAFGGWYECRAVWIQQQINFRLKVRAFERTSIAEIDQRRAGTVRVEGVLWLLSVEVVNLNKAPIRGFMLKECIKLIDADGYEFPALNMTPLGVDPTSPFHRFSGWMGNPPLSPKIKAAGSLAFDLPDEENVYSLAMNGGSINEA